MSTRIDIHILQSVPTSCLNRDEYGSPKTGFYGGVQRGRNSSQSEKRQLREYLKQKDPLHFGVFQTRFLAEKLAPELETKGLHKELCVPYAQAVAAFYGGWDNKAKREKTVTSFSLGEVILMSQRIKEAYDKDKCEKLFVLEKVKTNKPKSGKKPIKNENTEVSSEKKAEDKMVLVCKEALLKKDDKMADIGQIASFGRMMTSDPEIEMQGAISHAHSITVHENENDEDYLSAVDDVKPDSGSGHINSIECNSGCYYRFFSVDVDLFNKNMSQVSEDERRKMLEFIIEGCVVASLPNGRRNTMYAKTLPFAVLGLRRENSFDLSLADAFESPLVSDNGYKVESRNRLEKSWNEKKISLGDRLGVKKEIWYPDSHLDKFIEDLLNG